MIRQTLIASAAALMITFPACQRTATPEHPLELRPRSFTWPSWHHPLVHLETQPFYTRQIKVSPENRQEFDRLVAIVLDALTRLRRLQLGSLSMEDYTLRAERALQRSGGPRMPFGFLIYHTRSDGEGRLVAEGVTLTLGRVIESAVRGRYPFTIHVRLEDRADNGAVDGRLDDLQFIIDTNSVTLGAVEVSLTREMGPLGADHFDYTLSRFDGRRATTHQRSIAYRGEDNRLVVDICEQRLWGLFRDEQFLTLIRGDPVGHLLPGEETRRRRKPRDIPLGTNFPAMDKGE
jgi:hypothetical protein